MKEENHKTELLDSRRLAELLGLSQASCRKLAKAGKIQYSMSGSKMMFDTESVRRYMEG